MPANKQVLALLQQCAVCDHYVIDHSEDEWSTHIALVCNVEGCLCIDGVPDFRIMKPTYDLDEIERVAKAATPGPWYVGHPFTIIDGEPSRVACAIKDSIEGEDTNYIAALNPAVVLQMVKDHRDMVEALLRIAGCQFNGMVAMNIADEVLTRIGGASK